MKKSPVIALSLAASLLVFSCNKEEVSPKQEIPKEFSENTVEENKAQLEANGIEMIGQMEELKEIEAVDVSTRLLGLLMVMEEENLGGSAGGRILASLSKIKTGNASATEVFAAMRLKGPVPQGEPETLEDFFTIYAGNYEWVPATEEWDYTAGGEDVIFEFPATENSSSNNAVFSIHDYAGVGLANPMDAEYSGELPTKLVMDLTVEGRELMEYSFSAAYNGNGEPTSVKSSLTLAPFTFAVTLTNDTEKVGAAYSLKNEDKVLIALGINAVGNFDSNNTDNSVTTEDIIKEASAYFQLLNVKVAGKVDAANLAKEMNGLTGVPGQEAYVAKQVEVLNKHYELSVFYAKEKVKIADTEFYVGVGAGEHLYDEYGNDLGYEEIPVPSIRLIFADGSKADFATYFATGFDNVQKEYDLFFESL